MNALTWFDHTNSPDCLRRVEGYTVALSEQYLFRTRQIRNGCFALSVFNRVFGGQVFSKHYVSLHGAQTAAQRWLDKQAVRV